MKTKIIFITAASRGFGRIWAEAALNQGHRVIATARNINDLKVLVDVHGDSVLPLALDVRNREQVFSTIETGNKHFGSLDVVLNVAGYSLYGAIEETSEEEARAQLETNLLGPLWVTQAALPIMRKQKSGHIIQVSSVGGVIAFPNLGLYHASKWGLEAFSETLSKEVHNFGIKVTIVEPGVFETSKGDKEAVPAKYIEAYDEMRAALYGQFNSRKGDPFATSALIMKVIESDEPPLRVILGDQSLPIIQAAYGHRMSLWEKWREESVAAQGK